MKLANARMVIATPDLAEYLSPEHLGNAGVPLVLNLGFFGDIPKAGGDVVDEKSLESEYLPPSFSPPPRGLGDVAMVIYTSGTSGKPKAVSIKNFHLIIVSTPLQSDIDFPPEQGKQMRIFSCLPLFHGTAMFTAMLYGAGSSGTLCLARKFTASGFSRALYDSGATRMLYVGELCRYLIAAKPSPFDTAHQCRVASGNGLQADIWEKFQQRFGITHVREFYRGTEMIAKYDNFDGGKAAVGRCGFEGPLANWLNKHTYIVKYDTKTEAPYRDPKTGFCVLARADEPGEAIGRVNTMAFYHEYLNNQNANREKLMSDVFSKGDVFQRSGDLLVRSRDGWVRFIERSGDSYRWKGENVSAGEVKEHIARLPGVQEAEVFAVNLERYVDNIRCLSITLI
jgi:acyl-CoA synthetase (AMP-forming)/AMP-acid ligase II